MVSAYEALERFRESTRIASELVDGVSDPDWQRRPGDEPWSLAETVEHVVSTNQATLTRFEKQLRSAPLTPYARRFPDERITEGMFHDVPAPPGLAEPTGRFTTRREGTAALTAVCTAIEAYAREVGDRLRDFGLPHPVFGTFDGVQWVLFLGAHTDNHIPQLRRLRAMAEPRDRPKSI
jgi:hypothetical protein